MLDTRTHTHSHLGFEPVSVGFPPARVLSGSAVFSVPSSLSCVGFLSMHALLHAVLLLSASLANFADALGGQPAPSHDRAAHVSETSAAIRQWTA